jgi:hypothetical protein
VGLELDPLSVMSTFEELLGRKKEEKKKGRNEEEPIYITESYVN